MMFMQLLNLESETKECSWQASVQVLLGFSSGAGSLDQKRALTGMACLVPDMLAQQASCN